MHQQEGLDYSDFWHDVLYCELGFKYLTVTLWNWICTLETSTLNNLTHRVELGPNRDFIHPLHIRPWCSEHSGLAWVLVLCSRAALHSALSICCRAKTGSSTQKDIVPHGQVTRT